MTHIRHAAIAAVLLASAGTASAQTTVITREPLETQTIVREPVQTETVVTRRPLALTPVQRRTIYRTIVRERVEPVPPTVEYRIGARVPESATLYPVPDTVAVEVPTVRPYKYMVVNGEVVLVDPATGVVVAELAD
ncbi:MAG TPA: DUF1236 domain-containing protein [Steroidobacteraceae bacterium]|nr:DUF1236 domain-containing protein [Steroidobacteraceae bacterium]